MSKISGDAPSSDTSVRLAKFFESAATASWDGCGMDGGDIQDLAIRLGLFRKTHFDPSHHSDYNGVGAEPGDDWYVLAPDVVALLKNKPGDGAP